MKLAHVLIAASVLSTTAIAGPTQEKKKRDNVEAELARGASEMKDCGKSIKVAYDWTAFDKLDFAKLGTSKEEQLLKEVVSVRWVGHDIERLCKDKDYKEALGKIDTVLYVPSGDDKGKSVKASIAGKTLRLENYVGGSTRSGGDYESAAKAAL